MVKPVCKILNDLVYTNYDKQRHDSSYKVIQELKQQLQNNEP